MSFRRLTPPVVVLTGVENSGKTTLARALAGALDWAHLPEAARTDPAVTSGQVNTHDLQRLLAHHLRSVEHLQTTATPAIVCDTGPLVLDRWSSEAFGQPLDGALEAQQSVDLFLLCHTLPKWEPDPLRSLPRHEDRILHQQRYIDHLESHRLPWAMVPALTLSQRIETAKALLAQYTFLT